VANTSLAVDRASPSASFASESSEDDNIYRSYSPPSSELITKATSSTNTLVTTNVLMKRYAAQSRTNVLRSTSISPLIIRKQRQTSLINSTNNLHRPNLNSQGTPPNFKSNSIIEKKTTSTPSSQNTDRLNLQQSRLTNNKSQLITYTPIAQTMKKLSSVTPSTDRSVLSNNSKVRIDLYVFN
jgi:hypothetical protein